MKEHSAIKLFIEELNENNYKYINVNEVFKNNNLTPKEVELILKWLPLIFQEHLGSGIMLAQSLKITQDQFDPSILVKLFEESDLNSSVKASIGLVLAIAKTPDISKWVKDQLNNKPYSFERSSLVLALVKKGGFEGKEELKIFLESIFDKYPISVLEVYDKIGKNEDIDFLLDKLKISDKNLTKEIEKTVKKILRKENSNKKK